jgi:hypothetical protein
MLLTQLKGLEAIIKSGKMPPDLKKEAIRLYEQVLAQENGITRVTIEEAEWLLSKRGLSRKILFNELKEIEKTFIEGARKTHGDMKKPFNEKKWRAWFRTYAKSVYRKNRQARIERRNALLHLRGQRQAERRTGKKPAPWRPRMPK